MQYPAHNRINSGDFGPHFLCSIMEKIDTQGMSGPVDPNYKGSLTPQKHKPMIVTPRRLLSEAYVNEFKILINEVLDEREYQRKLRMAYDDPKQPGPSYFDVKEFSHSVDDPEPKYPLDK